MVESNQRFAVRASAAPPVVVPHGKTLESRAQG